MKTRYKIIIVVSIIVLSSSSLFFYLMDSERIVYPGTGWRMNSLESKLCEKLSGNSTTFSNCFGINDICEDVYGVLHYDKNRSEVGCSLNHRVDFNCTNLQLATGWVSYSDSLCFLPIDKELIESRK